jgi:hypothetical protein
MLIRADACEYWHKADSVMIHDARMNQNAPDTLMKVA